MNGIGDLETAESLQEIVSAGPVHILKDEIMQARGPVLARLEIANNVWVVKGLSARSLAAETVERALEGGMFGGEHLESDLPLCLAIVGEEHRAHAAFAKLSKNLETRELRE